MLSIRRGAASIYRILIILFAGAVVVEFFLAGLGIFRAMPSEDESVPHETFESEFEGHAGLGDILLLVSLVLMILIVVAWAGGSWIGGTFALAVLTFVQGALAGTGEDAPVAGAFHAINALLILGLAGFLTVRAWRGKLVSPPSPSRGPGSFTPSSQ